MYTFARRLTDSPTFDAVVAMMIVATAISTGLELVEPVARRIDVPLFAFFWASQVFFVAEITARILSFGPDFRAFFRDRWNTFDLAIVAASLLPLVGPLALLGRLLRTLRVLRLISLVARALRGTSGVRSGRAGEDR